MKKVREIMTERVVSVDPNATLREALEVFRAHDVTGAPVLDGSRVLGVLSVTDLSEFEATTAGVPTSREDRESTDPLLGPPERWADEPDPPSDYFVHFWADAGAEITSRFESPDAPEWDLLSDHRVTEAMTRQVIAIGPDASLREAARTMTDAGVHRLLVMEDGDLRGIVTTTDIVRAVAESSA